MSKFHFQYTRLPGDPPRPVIPAGALILMTGGPPDLYAIYGLYRALVDIDREAAIKNSGISEEEAQWLYDAAAQTHSIEEMVHGRFIRSLLAAGKIEALDCTEFHLGNANELTADR